MVVTGIVVELVAVDGGLGVADTPEDGVIDTSWKIPETGWKTITTAGVLREVPRAQLGWQLFTFIRPVPCPPVSASHDVQEMVVTVTPPVAHPTVRRVGRTCGVEDGPQDNTAGSGGRVEVVVGPVAVVEDFPWAPDEAPLAADFVCEGVPERMARPIAIPRPSVATTRTTIPSRVRLSNRVRRVRRRRPCLARSVVTRGYLSTTIADRSW